MGVAIGVDSHKSSLAVGALNEVGRLEEVREFAQRPARTRVGADLDSAARSRARDRH